jgi:hypothetical protein
MAASADADAPTTTNRFVKSDNCHHRYSCSRLLLVLAVVVMVIMGGVVVVSAEVRDALDIEYIEWDNRDRGEIFSWSPSPTTRQFQLTIPSRHLKPLPFPPYQHR